jgi:hypothetical protein
MHSAARTDMAAASVVTDPHVADETTQSYIPASPFSTAAIDRVGPVVPENRPPSTNGAPSFRHW